MPTPRDYGHEEYEDLKLRSPDGEDLGAFLIKPRKLDAKQDLTILMFHGNAGNIGHRVPIAIKLQDCLECNVLMLEYRGYGSSTGTPNEQGLLIDAQTGLDYIRDRQDLKRTKVVVYGQSLGGALAIQLVAGNQGEGRIAGMILENTFTSMQKLIPSAFPPAKYLTRLCHQIWPSEDVLPKITDVPVLFLSGLKDEIVPPQHMSELFRICRSRRKVWRTLPNGDHNAAVLEPGYFDFIINFINEDVLGRKEP